MYENYILNICNNVLKLCNLCIKCVQCMTERQYIVRKVNIFCLADRKKKKGTPYFAGCNSDLSLSLPKLKLCFRKVATYST